MSKLLAEIKHDLNFIKSHTLQPRWFKVLKIFVGGASGMLCPSVRVGEYGCILCQLYSADGSCPFCISGQNQTLVRKLA